MQIEQFQQYRPLLFAIAYRMLGTVTEAEDVLQDAYLRVRERPSSPIKNPKYYLTTTVTNLCLNHLNSARQQREQYLGPWLPEPIVTADKPELVNPLNNMVISDSISTAFLLLLEALSPAERAAFLLHEVFDYTHGEIAEMLDKSVPACRQLLRRAKNHIAANRPRFEATDEQHERLLQGFMRAADLGEVDAFLQLLAEDVTFVPDGGGERGAAVHVLHGREVVAQFVAGTYQLAAARYVRYELATLNGQRAILARTGKGRPFFALFLYSDDGTAVQLIHVIAGRKLAALKH